MSCQNVQHGVECRPKTWQIENDPPVNVDESPPTAVGNAFQQPFVVAA